MIENLEHLQTADFSVAIILSPSFTLLPLSGFIDCLRHAADDGDNSRQIYCKWSIVGPSLEPVRSSCGVEISPWETFDEVDLRSFDYVVVVGGLMRDFDTHDPATFEFLKDARSVGCALIGLCTGCFAIAKAGLMEDGARCAVHFRHREEFKELYPLVRATQQEIFVEHDNIFTCPGGTSAIDLAVDIIARHSGRARATKGLMDMIVDGHRGAFHMPPLPTDELEMCGNPHVEAAVKLMRRQLSEPCSISKLARKIGVSTAQLQRAFLKYADRSPSAYWREIRLRHARWRLMNSSHSITSIAFECGFADGAHFTRSFLKRFGETPSELRHERGYTNRDMESSI